MTLTEQWKKGELEQGYYYVKGVKKYDGINVYWIGYPIHETERMWIKEVLAPVPTFDEYKQLIKFLEEFNALDVAKENQQLRELLLECKLRIGDEYITENEIRELYHKIDEVLK